MKEYQRSMAAAVRWAILAMFGISLFWLVWNAITGSIPITLSIKDSQTGTAFPPLPYSRWWDPLAAFIAILTLWPFLFGFIKLAYLLGVKESGLFKLTTHLKIWLGVGLSFGLLLSLGDVPIGWLSIFWGTSSGIALLAGLMFGWGGGLVSGLGLWLGECLGFGLIFGLGIGWVVFVVGDLVLSLIGIPIATLVIGLSRGFISRPWPRFRDWLAAKDVSLE